MVDRTDGIDSETLYQLEKTRQGFQCAVNCERGRHLQKWGVQKHSLDVWAIILGEEFGEFLQAVNDYRLASDIVSRTEARIQAEKELVEVAAVAAAIYEEYFKIPIVETPNEGSDII